MSPAAGPGAIPARAEASARALPGWAGLPSSRATPEQIKDAFEALLVAEILKPFEQSLTASGFFPGSAAGDIYAHFWKQHLGQLLAGQIDLLPGWGPGAGEGSAAAGVSPAAGDPGEGAIDLSSAAAPGSAWPLRGRAPRVFPPAPGRPAPPDPSGPEASAAGPPAVAGPAADPPGAAIPSLLRPAAGPPADLPAALRSARPEAAAAWATRVAPDADEPPPAAAEGVPRRAADRALTARVGPFEEAIQEASRLASLGANWLRAVIVQESGGDPRAVSPKGAQGLMQLLPATGRALGVNDPFDPLENIRAGARYLAGLLRQFGDMRLALAAYNAGPGRVATYGGVPPFRETQTYIERVLTLKEEFDRLLPGDGAPRP